MSFHLLGKYEQAESILLTFEDVFKDQPAGPLSAYEDSEVALYFNTILVESGDYQKALEHLNTIKTRVVDTNSWLEMRGKLLHNRAFINLKLQNHQDAGLDYESLVDKNPENVEYLKGLAVSKGFINADGSSKSPEIFAFFQALSAKYPKSYAIMMQPLSYADGDDFKSIVDIHFVKMLRKGVPSLFKSFKDVLRNKKKMLIVQELMESYYDSLKNKGKFANSNGNF